MNATVYHFYKNYVIIVLENNNIEDLNSFLRSIGVSVFLIEGLLRSQYIKVFLDIRVNKKIASVEKLIKLCRKNNSKQGYSTVTDFNGDMKEFTEGVSGYSYKINLK